MAIWDNIPSFNFGSFSFGFDYSTILTAVGGILVLLLIVYLFGRGGSRFGRRRERRAVKSLGVIGAEGRRGSSLWNTLVWSAKASVKLGKLAYKGAKLVKNSKIGQRLAQETGGVIGGEERNIEEAIHQSSAAAATIEMDRLILRPINTDIKEDEEKRAIEVQLSELAQRLAGISSYDDINGEVSNLIIPTGLQMTSAYIKLAHNEEFEVNVRKKSFAEAYSKGKVIVLAERLARRVANILFRNQQKISKYLFQEFNEMKRYLKETVKKQQEDFKSLFGAYKLAKDHNTKAQLASQMADAQKAAKVTMQNVSILLQSLKQLKAVNVRMMGNLEKVYNDIQTARQQIKGAQARLSAVEAAEKGVDEQAKELKALASSAEENFKEMQHRSPEFIIIRLSSDTAAILTSLIRISERIMEIDSTLLTEFMQSLNIAISAAYRAEESTRIANTYYKELLKANESFYDLILETDLAKEMKPFVVQEVQIDKMEEQIASKVEGVEQATKTLFIRAIHEIQDSTGRIQQHVEYLKNLIGLTERTRRYTIDILSWIMHIISERKSEMGIRFATQAMQYQASLDKVLQSAGLARRAAAPVIPFQQAAA